MRILKRLKSIFVFQRKYGAMNNLAFFNNTSKNVKSPYRSKSKKPLKTLKFGVNSVIFNSNIFKGTVSNLWKHSFRPTFAHERYFSNVFIKDNDRLKIKRCLKSLKKQKTEMLLKYDQTNTFSKNLNIIKEL
jgi:hypothetical protein